MAAKRTIQALLIALAALLALLVAVGLVYTVYENNNIFIEDSVYPADAESLDLREQEISIAHYEALREELPQCQISWSVPFQGRRYPDDTREITITSLRPDEVPVLTYLKDLRAVDALECDDYEALQMLEETLPDCDVQYKVQLGDSELSKNCRKLSFEKGEVTAEELRAALPFLKVLREIHLKEPDIAAEELLKLREEFPEVKISWEKTVFGALLPDDIQEVDISGMQNASLEEIRRETDYLPGLQKLIMSDCGFDNETMYDFREEMRPQYKVVWTVQVGRMRVRTDETYFMPTKYKQYVLDREIDPLYYCEDMICVDVGHHPIHHVDWVAGMPHLKYLIVADGPIRDITPLSQLKEVVWLELFMTDIRDITPLLSMTSLQDLNLARVPADLRPLAQMKWLNNLWISGGWVSGSTVAYLRENMPDTYIDAAHHHNCCGRGWRQLQNYYDMRDILGMPYFLD